MDKKLPTKTANLTKLLGGNPEKMDRSQWDSALEKLFQKIKKTNKDPFSAKTELNEKLNEAFSKDFLSFDKHKDLDKQLQDALSLYGLNPEEIKKVKLDVLKELGEIKSSSGVIGGGTWLLEDPKFKSGEEYAKSFSDYLKKGEFTPQVLGYDIKNKPEFLPHVTIPHEARHAADYFQNPESVPFMEDRELISLKNIPAEKSKRQPILESIKKDPSLKNILLQSKSVEHFQPVTPLKTPGYAPHETIFAKTHPVASEPDIIAPEQPEATGIFKKEETPSVSQDELYNALYDMDSGGYSTDPLLNKNFSKLSKIFNEIKERKKETPKPKVSPKEEMMFEPDEFERQLQMDVSGD